MGCLVVILYTMKNIFQACLAGHQASSKARDKVCSLSYCGGRYDVLALLEHRHCSGEFKQPVLTCIEGCGLRKNRFKVLAAACALY